MANRHFRPAAASGAALSRLVKSDVRRTHDNPSDRGPTLTFQLWNRLCREAEPIVAALTQGAVFHSSPHAGRVAHAVIR